MRDRSERFSAVPWLSDADLRPMGDPGTVVEMGGGEEIAWGLWVREPFGRGTEAVLTIHATRGDGTDGGEITLAITNELRIDQPAVDVNLQSNPRRSDDGD